MKNEIKVGCWVLTRLGLAVLTQIVKETGWVYYRYENEDGWPMNGDPGNCIDYWAEPDETTAEVLKMKGAHGNE